MEFLKVTGNWFRFFFFSLFFVFVFRVVSEKPVRYLRAFKERKLVTSKLVFARPIVFRCVRWVRVRVWASGSGLPAAAASGNGKK